MHSALPTKKAQASHHPCPCRRNLSCAVRAQLEPGPENVVLSAHVNVALHLRLSIPHRPGFVPAAPSSSHVTTHCTPAGLSPLAPPPSSAPSRPPLPRSASRGRTGARLSASGLGLEYADFCFARYNAPVREGRWCVGGQSDVVWATAGTCLSFNAPAFGEGSQY